MKTLPLLICLFLFSCRDNPSSLRTPFENIVVLKIGHNLQIGSENLEIGFDDVPDDSRCSIGSVCVWPGRAEIRLWLLRVQSDSTFVTLTLSGFVTRDDTTGHISKDTLGYRLSLVQLDPYPVLDRPQPISSYEATVKISKL